MSVGVEIFLASFSYTFMMMRRHGGWCLEFFFFFPFYNGDIFGPSEKEKGFLVRIPETLSDNSVMLRTLLRRPSHNSIRNSPRRDSRVLSHHVLSGLTTAVRTPVFFALAARAADGRYYFPRAIHFLGQLLSWDSFQDDDADAPPPRPLPRRILTRQEVVVGGLAQVECQPARVLAADVSRQRSGGGGTGGEVCRVALGLRKTDERVEAGRVKNIYHKSWGDRWHAGVVCVLAYFSWESYLLLISYRPYYPLILQNLHCFMDLDKTAVAVTNF